MASVALSMLADLVEAVRELGGGSVAEVSSRASLRTRELMLSPPPIPSMIFSISFEAKPASLGADCNNRRVFGAIIKLAFRIIFLNLGRYDIFSE